MNRLVIRYICNQVKVHARDERKEGRKKERGKKDETVLSLLTSHLSPLTSPLTSKKEKDEKRYTREAGRRGEGSTE